MSRRAAEPRRDDTGRIPATRMHCGQCDETRHRQTPFGVIRCPDCHPLADVEDL